MDVEGTPLLVRVVERARRAAALADVVVATSQLPSDEAIVGLCRERGIPCFTGSESDVLDRYHGAAVATGADPVVRITGDCPLVDPGLIDQVVASYADDGYEHVGVAAGAGASRLDGGRFPTGFDVECFSFGALERAWAEATAPTDREHVTPYIWRTGLFRTGMLRSDRDLVHYRCSVDTPEDLALVRAVVAELGDDFSFGDVIALLDARPDIARLNVQHIGNEGHDRVWEAA
jgi:spore coat polysaccharide biosynthesis protein SpsF (cytidylyltransferase family)